MYLRLFSKLDTKLSAAKNKMDQNLMMTYLKKNFGIHSTLAEKDAKICALEENQRHFHHAAEQPGVNLKLSLSQMYILTLASGIRPIYPGPV